MTKTIVLQVYRPHRMAKVLQGKTTLFLGNFWDFHPGCHGTIFRLEDGTEIEIPNFYGPRNFAEIVARRIGGKVKVKERKRTIPC